MTSLWQQQPGCVPNTASFHDADSPEAMIRAVVHDEIMKLRDWLDTRLPYYQQDSTQCSSPEQPQAPRIANPFSPSDHKEIPKPPLAAGDATTSIVPQASPAPISGSASGKFDKAALEQLNFWKERLREAFHILDADRSGSIDRKEIKNAFAAAGVPPNSVFEAFVKADSSGDGNVDWFEWDRLIEISYQSADEDTNAFVDFAKKLIEGQLEPRRRRSCVIPFDSGFRAGWDLLILVALLYLTISLPFTLGFVQLQEAVALDYACDAILLVDIFLTFFTTYVNEEGVLVTSNYRIALHYFRTWFGVDLLSSVPWDAVTAGLMPSLQPARLLKVGKIFKVVKLLRIGKLLMTWAGSEVAETIEEVVPMKLYQFCGKIGYLVAITAMLCHWLACLLGALDSNGIDEYIGENESQSRRYLSALYWSMATLTTVGYGDLVPKTDEGRAYAMLAMIVGGGFYGYTVGCITSLVTETDLETRGKRQRMELMEAWLHNHRWIPRPVRRRIRRHVRTHRDSESTLDNSSIMESLSQELRCEVASFLVHEQVRSNPIIQDLPNSALAALVDVIRKSASSAGEMVVRKGDPGFAMHIITEGIAYVTEGKLWRQRSEEDKYSVTEEQKAPPVLEYSSSMVTETMVKLYAGDSFGEEILLQLAQAYQYTVVAKSAVVMCEIPEDGFEKRFRHMPHLQKQMLASFRELNRVQNVQP